ncbi:septum formation family protein [Micromonospora sp. WMMD1128]|uniref:septum formation family protein n=1 Tax=unclassified Micromonospora TaxID=2617518 RepID=UPI00248D0375|nr:MULTISPECIES: septum formation family protein [unclassified Micromonospora]WBB71542.1 septum formation family protein [Micromonospora sp. WMMD1128]WFE35012.1 septum formation family protein [Micromonospora sp. WMMD975]
MRRWWAAVAAGAAAVLALGGCQAPAGVDRDLTDEWPAFAAPVGFVPETDVCHPTVADVGYLSGYQPVDCAAEHRAETLHVGTLTGPEADRSAPPRAGSAGIRAAHAECARQVTRAVGGDWRSGRLQLSVVFPSALAWSGGARWYRCDVAEVSDLDEGNVTARTGSLRGALKRGSPLALACFNPKLSKDEVQAMRPVACTAKHHAEFVGIYQAPDIPYAEFQRTSLRAHKACRGLIAKYAKLPDDNNLQYRAGTIIYHPFEQQWRDGDRGVQCFLWVSDRTLTRSVRGAGGKALPIT